MGKRIGGYRWEIRSFGVRWEAYLYVERIGMDDRPVWVGDANTAEEAERLITAQVEEWARGAPPAPAGG